MKFNKVPAILGVITAAVVVVVVLLVSGGEEAKTPVDGGGQTTQSGDDGSQAATGGGQGGQEGSGGDGGQGSRQPKPEPDPEPVIEVRDGAVVGGPQELSFEPGEQIAFAVASDTADEIHFHGYDLYADIPAGGEGKIEAPAELEGVFEVELHDSGLEVAEVTVSP